MAIRHINDDGSNTSPYETWAKAATTTATAVTGSAAGDEFRIGADHAENTAGNVTYTFPGTQSNPNKFVSMTVDTTTYNKADNIQVDTGANNNMNINGSVQFYGVSFKIGDDSSWISSSNNFLYWEDCLLEFARGDSVLTMGATAGRTSVVFKNTDITFSVSGSVRGFAITASSFRWDGGRLLVTGPSFPTALFNGGTRMAVINVSGVDMAQLESAIVDISDTKPYIIQLHHCLLHSSVSLTTGTIIERSSRVLMSGCDDTTGNNLFRLEYEDFWGSTFDDAATFRTTGGAKDPDGNAISWQMVSASRAVEFTDPTKSPPIVKWVKTTGSKTFTVNCLWDSAVDIQDDEVWLEIEYLSASADTDSDLASDRMADIQATPADQTTNAVAWTISPSMTNANEFEVAVTVTVNRVGPVIAHVCLAKPSTTIFADPKLEIT